LLARLIWMIYLPDMIRAFVLFALFCAACSAEVTWQHQTIEVDCTIEQKNVLVSFPFRNTGTQTVDVTQTTSTCGCLTTGLDQITYAPGESGSLDVVFAIGSRSGRQQKLIKVLVQPADGSEPQPVRLTLVAHIPEWLRFSHRSASWRIDDPAPQAKTFRISVLRDQPISVLSATATSNAFATELRIIEPGRLYDLIVTPTVPGAAAHAVIEVTTNAEVEKVRLVRIPVALR